MITIDDKSIQDFLSDRVNRNTYHDYEFGEHQFDSKEAVHELAVYLANLIEVLKLDKQQVMEVFNLATFRVKEKND